MRELSIIPKKRFLYISWIILIIFPIFNAFSQNTRKVTFRFQPVISGINKVYLAGTFNDWNDSKTPMSDLDQNGTYEVTLLLPPGEYLYKFVVDGNWLTDPNAQAYEPDGMGGKNAIIIVDENLPPASFVKGDGDIYIDDILLDMNYSAINPIDENTIEFKAKAYRNDIDEIVLHYLSEENEQMIKLVKGESDLTFHYYKISLNFPTNSSIRFIFRYQDGDKLLYAVPEGFLSVKPDKNNWFHYNQEILPFYKVPEWAQTGIIYQIFPDRFFNGDKSNDQDFSESYYEGKTELPSDGKINDEYFHFVSDWDDIGGLIESPYRTDGKPDYYSFYGGDIAGVIEKLPYLKDLGITIIYFNPLNEGMSNHKYDAADYMKIDPHFSDEATFKLFIEKAHEFDIRIIIDFAFNHTGNTHFAFVDTRDKGPQSKYWKWFEWKKWPLPPEGPPTPCDYYDCWWGFPLHPNLNYDLSRPNEEENEVSDINDAEPNWEVVNYVLNVARYWLGELDVDGFRLDVPNEVPFWMWKEFRKVVDEVKPDAFLIGEIWGNALDWLGPHCFHSTMNYKFFREPVLKFFATRQTTAKNFDEELAPGRNLYPIQSTHAMMNLIGSHDTKRFINFAENKNKRVLLAILFQMTYIGMPHIYYGDEVRLTGGNDPDNRRTFPWDWEQDNNRKEFHEIYKNYIKLRHKYPVLKTGEFKSVYTDGRVYGYLRYNKKDTLFAILNNEEKEVQIIVDLHQHGINMECVLKNVFDNKRYFLDEGKLDLTLKQFEGVLFYIE
jgi:glycosidase